MTDADANRVLYNLRTSNVLFTWNDERTGTPEQILQRFVDGVSFRAHG